MPLARILPSALLSAVLLVAAHVAHAESVRVMSFNIWVGGESGGQPTEQTVAVIKAARADVVGLQESHGREHDGVRRDAAALLAKQLGWNYFDQGDDDTGVISRYKIVGSTPKKWGVEFELPTGERFWLFNAHFAHAPYQPYQLLKIPYADAPFLETAEEAVKSARDARESQVKSMLAEIEAVRGEGKPIFITGDFNEPPALDWTEAAHAVGLHPAVVCWPATAMLQEARFVDAYRTLYPDPVQQPGFTWTVLTAEDDPADHHDRIDFVFATPKDIELKSAEIVGERSERADIVVTPYPSDHRAVVVEAELK
ncbi:endonuclease/exonuclease/phosphatase family protein [Lacipirellula sp.]|uniref:endonuclease/exonuclease/phosphatase family protein n=1 Tax=Lacipirellula sp. TaxID=2691419 RepID=UPI003D09BBE6